MNFIFVFEKKSHNNFSIFDCEEKKKVFSIINISKIATKNLYVKQNMKKKIIKKNTPSKF